MRLPTRKQINNIKGHKDPRKKALRTKIHDDKHEYKRNEIIMCEECNNEAVSCVCSDLGD